MIVRYWPRGRRASEISADIERALAAGHLHPGDRLPAVRSLAERLAISPATAAAAYQDLGRRGVVHADGRRGTRIADRPPVANLPRPAPRTRQIPTAPDHRDLSIGNPDPALLPAAAPALAAAGSRPPRLYGDHPIDESFAAWAVADLTADGIPSDAVTAVNGALDGIERVLEAWARPGDTIAVEDPGYSPLLDLLAALGLRPAPVAVDPAGPDPDALARVLAAGATTVVLTPRAQNPTGAAIDAERARELQQVLDHHPSALVIEDDHAGPVAGAPTHAVSSGRERWAFVRSVAKSLGPDFRLAALAGDPLTVARVEGRQRLGPGWVSRFLQHAAALLATDDKVRDSLDLAARTYAERRNALHMALAERQVPAQGCSGMNLWVPVPDEATVTGHLGAAGWVVAPGARFRQKAPSGIRVTTAALAIDDAPAAADAIADALAATGTRSTVRLG